MRRSVALLVAFISAWSARAAEPRRFDVMADLTNGDVDGVELTVFLGPDATRRLEEATTRTLGHDLTVTVEGVHAVTAITMGVVGSGTISTRPSPALLEKLRQILASPPGPEHARRGAPGDEGLLELDAGDVRRVEVTIFIGANARGRLARAGLVMVDERTMARDDVHGATATTVNDEDGVLTFIDAPGSPELLAKLQVVLASKTKGERRR